jgi:hypothetical protein
LLFERTFLTATRGANVGVIDWHWMQIFPAFRSLDCKKLIPFDTSSAVRLHSPPSITPVEIMSRLFRNVRHHRFCRQQLAVA